MLPIDTERGNHSLPLKPSITLLLQSSVLPHTPHYYSPLNPLHLKSARSAFPRTIDPLANWIIRPSAPSRQCMSMLLSSDCELHWPIPLEPLFVYTTEREFLRQLDCFYYPHVLRRSSCTRLFHSCTVILLDDQKVFLGNILLALDGRRACVKLSKPLCFSNKTSTSELSAFSRFLHGGRFLLSSRSPTVEPSHPHCVGRWSLEGSI